MNRYTHGHHESVLRSHRQRTAENSAGYLLAHLRPVLQHVADPVQALREMRRVCMAGVGGRT